MDIESVEVDVTLRRQLDLAAPLNVVLRRLLGARLRDFRCLTRAPTCEGCDLGLRCDHIRVFETPAAVAPGAHGSHSQHPFWLRGVPAAHRIVAGTTLRARVATVGFARPLLPYLDVALRERVAAGAANSTAWTVRAVTPLVLNGDVARAQEECPAAPWLSLLVRSGVRRVRSLLTAYAGEVDGAVVVSPGLREVTVVQKEWSRWRSSRYSARQGQRMPLSGWVGRRRCVARR